ncbi:YrvL family regulatory protein [Bacillus haynesii]|uniref:YrvL family regulatory protein n=1 Tax=Bacillus haynesii TaxID=1925021 RepID=UPI0003EDA28C|nr:YrvL family regulatory protein [Bacillus haynesii]EWH23329.1 peptidase [Bacillus haynesii]
MKHFIICCLSVMFVFFAHFLGISILFHLPGAFYQTVGSLLLFTLCYSALTFVLEPAEKLLIHSMKLLGINRRITFFAAEMITIGCLWAAIYTADELLGDVLLTTSAEIMIAVSFFTIDKILYPRQRSGSLLY